MSTEIILAETSKFFTTRPHTQTHLQASHKLTCKHENVEASKFKLKQLFISNRRHLIRLRGNSISDSDGVDEESDYMMIWPKKFEG